MTRFQVKLGEWKDFEDEDNGPLVRAFEAGHAKTTLTMRGQRYDFDFKEMTQKNPATGKIREIRPPFRKSPRPDGGKGAKGGKGDRHKGEYRKGDHDRGGKVRKGDRDEAPTGGYAWASDDLPADAIILDASAVSVVPTEAPPSPAGTAAADGPVLPVSAATAAVPSAPPASSAAAASVAVPSALPKASTPQALAGYVSPCDMPAVAPSAPAAKASAAPALPAKAGASAPPMDSAILDLF